MSASENHNVIDISHHLSEVGRKLQKFAVAPAHIPGVINLDKAVPDVEDCPITSISVQYVEPSAFSLEPTGTPSPGPDSGEITGTEPANAQYVISRQLREGDQNKFQLKTALTYSPITGLPGLEPFIREWVAKVHKPAHNNWKTLIDMGSAPAWASCLTIFLNPGDSFITDYYAYNVALTQARAMGMVPVTVATDLDGISAVELEQVLTSWDEKSRGSRRPRLIYSQGGVTNPTGQLTTAQRKKEIYDVAVRHDLIIIEDDPYYFQQASGPYRSSGTQTNATQTDEQWLESLVPSFLRFDYQGRVIRLDTFSKSIAPGGRLGYYTAPTLVIEKLMALGDTMALYPSGFSQAIIGELLYKYQTAGFTRWLRGICVKYELRRNWMIDALHNALDIQPKDNSSRTLTAYAPSDTQNIKSLMSFAPPAGGMCIWFNIHLQNHPRYQELRDRTSIAAAKDQLATELWSAIAKAGVMIRRGELCAAEDGNKRAKRGEEGSFLRASFGNGTKDYLQQGMTIFAAELIKFFE
ncbi:Aminotran-1-2 domain-containing protein [Mycena venus]|uniref:Aminotran-1-2 domain-containing protein n=1 Tax=Mycena venus TaxID=2733690 RepID=A0A8H6Y6U4_9AGAR|nr:Aminotran-1-2 domain-containing protein [Mycena venus]